MVHRIWGLLIALIIVPDIYIWLHYYRTRYLHNRFIRRVWWIPCAVMTVYTIGLSTIRNFAPTDLTWLNTYLFLFGIFIGPKALFALCSWIGSALRALFHMRYNYGHRIGLAVGSLGVVAYIYGLTFGVGKIVVRHVDISFNDLPEEFDGYRILQISDIHTGTFDGWRRKILHAEIDSIRKQKDIDLVCFTGDMQNMRPEEVEKMMPELRRLPYMYSVLGNHDYAQYVKSTPQLEESMRKKLVGLENQLGHVLLNANIPLHRTMKDGSHSKATIWLAGEENDARPPYPDRANLKKTLKGIPDSAFVILMQHDPSAWQRDILPHSNVQLTLSGHTHGGQMQIFGFRVTELTQDEDLGLYDKQGRYLYVNAGLGGLVPFRLNMPNEITVITLHKTTNNNNSHNSNQS